MYDSAREGMCGEGECATREGMCGARGKEREGERVKAESAKCKTCANAAVQPLTTSLLGSDTIVILSTEYSQVPDWVNEVSLCRPNPQLPFPGRGAKDAPLRRFPSQYMNRARKYHRPPSPALCLSLGPGDSDF